MNLNIFRRAFSLTELMIVLVILAVLFSAMAPIFTKRQALSDENINSVWHYVNQNDGSGDIYYDGQVPSWTSTAIIGINPDSMDSSDYEPYAKMIIRAFQGADKTQAHIQFRYGANKGSYTGLFMATSSSPTPSRYSQMITMKTPRFGIGYANTVAGLGAYARQSGPYYSVAIGANSYAGVSDIPSNAGQHQAGYSVAVGVNSGQYLSMKSNYNTLIGSNVAKGVSGYNTMISNTTAIGSNVLGLESSTSINSVLVGADVASVGMDDIVYSNPSTENNVILGSVYYPKYTQRSTILGYHTLESGASLKNATAAGFGACNAVKNTHGISTCIGYGSAANSDINKVRESFDSDGEEHIYIGGQPAGFGGRAALEIHNFSDTNSKGNVGGNKSGVPTPAVKPLLGPTVVLNSNLAVRGNVYFSYVTDGELYASRFGLGAKNLSVKDKEQGRDDCCGTGLFRNRNKGWHRSKTCNWGEAIVDALADTFEAIVSVFDVIIDVCFRDEVTWWVDIWGEGAKRTKDPVSSVAIHTIESKPCTSYGSNYPNTKYCPQLEIFSDIRLKNVIAENRDALNVLMMIEPYHYTFKVDKKALPQVGVIAQDLQKYSPNSVIEGKDGYLSIRWDEMFFATINSVKDLNNQLNVSEFNMNNLDSDSKLVKTNQEQLQKRINSLNARLEKLEND